MKEIQGKSILARVIGSRLSLEDFALILVSFCFFHHKGSTVIYTEVVFKALSRSKSDKISNI